MQMLRSLDVHIYCHCVWNRTRMHVPAILLDCTGTRALEFWSFYSFIICAINGGLKMWWLPKPCGPPTVISCLHLDIYMHYSKCMHTGSMKCSVVLRTVSFSGLLASI